MPVATYSVRIINIWFAKQALSKLFCGNAMSESPVLEETEQIKGFTDLTQREDSDGF